MENQTYIYAVPAQVYVESAYRRAVSTAEGGTGWRKHEEAPLVGEDERPGQRKRRLLCIDGGGILGTFPAAFLAELEQHLDRPIGSYFDLIAGTSTGGIIGIALALGHSASEILNLYEKRGPEIFGQDRDALGNFLGRRLRGIRWLYRNKYGSEALRDALQDVLGDRRIAMLKPVWWYPRGIRWRNPSTSTRPRIIRDSGRIIGRLP